MLHQPVVHTEPLAGGCVSQVLRVRCEDGSSVVVKHGGSTMHIEAAMLRTLAERSELPLPGVIAVEPDLLVLEYIEHDNTHGNAVEKHAACLLASLHSVSGESFGYDGPSLIGPLCQPCKPETSWVRFFARQRLAHFGQLAFDKGTITQRCWDQLRSLADSLENWLDEPEAPSLIHGDIWSGNVLTRHNAIAAFIDPATHYAHAEVELAFITLFSTFGRTFFDAYHAIRPIPEGFFQTRRHIYTLYPLLVHAILFGSSYGRQVQQQVSLFV